LQHKESNLHLEFMQNFYILFFDWQINYKLLIDVSYM
jgi:hypothetical protein